MPTNVENIKMSAATLDIWSVDAAFHHQCIFKDDCQFQLSNQPKHGKG